MKKTEGGEYMMTGSLQQEHGCETGGDHWHEWDMRPLRLMLIDDDRVCLALLAQACEAAGHFCETFSSPVRALQAYSRESRAYDVVLSDLMMPEMNGLQLLQGVREIAPQALVIIVSGCSDFNTVVDAINYRAYSFFLKPFNIGDILTTLDRAGRELEKQRKVQDEQDLLLKEYIKLKRDFGEARMRLRKFEAKILAQKDIEV